MLADTHTRGASRPLPPSAWVHVESADRILHAGDVCEPVLLDELASFAPVSVVMGNCDALDIKEWGAPERADLELDGIRIGMVHDSGVRSGRRTRLRNLFPDTRVVVFGHSHLPVNEDADGLLLFNPGSPTWKRQAAWPSMGLLWIDSGEVEGEIFPV